MMPGQILPEPSFLREHRVGALIGLLLLKLSSQVGVPFGGGAIQQPATDSIPVLGGCRSCSLGRNVKSLPMAPLQSATPMRTSSSVRRHGVGGRLRVPVAITGQRKFARVSTAIVYFKSSALAAEL